MERLTHIRLDGLKTNYSSPSNKQDLIDRLAAYDDSGLMPEDVKTLADRNKPVTVSLPSGDWWVKDNDGNVTEEYTYIKLSNVQMTDGYEKAPINLSEDINLKRVKKIGKFLEKSSKLQI